MFINFKLIKYLGPIIDDNGYSISNQSITLT